MDDYADRAAALEASKPTGPPPDPPAAGPDYQHLIQQRRYEPRSHYVWVWSDRLQEWLTGWLFEAMQDERGWWATVGLMYGGHGSITAHESRMSSVPGEEHLPSTP